MATIKERIDNVTDDVTQGKQNISSAITEKGVETTSSATFSVMADNIRAIESGAKNMIYNSDETIYVIAGEKGVTMGDGCRANGTCSIAEGYGPIANGVNSHAEGYDTTTYGDNSHAEGHMTYAGGDNSHSEGDNCNAYGKNAHAEGDSTQAHGTSSHAEGNYTIASGWCSHTSGNYTQTFNEAEFACGRHNKSTSGDTYNSSATLFSVGFGTPPSESSRKNAIEVTMTGALKCNVAWQTGSDRKLKDNITPLENDTLNKVLQLNPVRFTLKDDAEKKEKIGFIAQEVEEVFPEYVMVSVDNDGEETRYLDYSQMVSILCKAIQELTKKVEMLENK